jgi:BirA family biotin operon repressor/biotin-[acetyl-CoA-carboxylase] ligase
MNTQSDWATPLQTTINTMVIGREIRFFPSVGSTNDLLKDAARLGAPEGLVFVTDEQVAGRGRRGRSWTAPPGTSLLVSVLLRPTWLPAAAAFHLTMLAAVVAAEAIEKVTGLTVDLKWPNDLQIEGRKLGGILVETELDDTAVHWAVIGCGINVNWDPRAIPELVDTATSLSSEQGQPVSRSDLLQAMLECLDPRYHALQRGVRSVLWNDWRRRLKMLGQAVRAETAHGVLLGIAEDVSPDGALLLRDANGQRHMVTAGDVSVRSIIDASGRH